MSHSRNVNIGALGRCMITVLNDKQNLSVKVIGKVSDLKDFNQILDAFPYFRLFRTCTNEYMLLTHKTWKALQFYPKLTVATLEI